MVIFRNYIGLEKHKSDIDPEKLNYNIVGKEQLNSEDYKLQ